jgi:hypothetical protein
MLRFETVNQNYTRAGALIAAALALSGCGLVSKSGESSRSVPGCPTGYEGTQRVTNQDAVITAFEVAGQKLAAEYKTSKPGNSRKLFGIAFNQLFDTSGSKGLFNTVTSTNEKLTPDAYLADDPSELFCEINGDNSDSTTVLSPNSIEAKAILGSVGIKVHLNRSVE